MTLRLRTIWFGLFGVSICFHVATSFTPNVAPIFAPPLQSQSTSLRSPAISLTSEPKPLILSWRLFSTTKETSSSNSESTATLDGKQLDFTLGYLNKHHPDLLIAFAETFSSLGIEKAKKNAWSGGSYKIEDAKIVHIDTMSMELDVTVVERSRSSRNERVTFELGTRYCTDDTTTICVT